MESPRMQLAAPAGVGGAEVANQADPAELAKLENAPKAVEGSSWQEAAPMEGQ